MVQTDASSVGIAAVLYQDNSNGKRSVIFYASAKLTKTQQRYHVNKQECLAIVWAVKRYRPYLEDREFTLRTDNKALLWLNTAKDSNAKLTRWALLLQEFKFVVEHCAGKTNYLPDLLSRNPEEDEVKPEVESIDRMLIPGSSTGELPPIDPPLVLQAIDVPTLADEVKTAQHNKPNFGEVVRRYESILTKDPQAPGDASFIRHYEVRDGHLFK